MSVPVQAAVAVARSPKALKLLLALVAGLAISLLFVAAVLVSSVGAVASMCQAEESSTTPSGTPGGYVSTEPSDEALADIPAHYLSVYRKAADEYGLDWAVLAAVGKIETEHGEGGKETTCINSSAGAQGPMQFMPGTWASMGMDGNGDGRKDVCYYEDAIYGAVNYLSQSGAPQDYQAALFAYNNAQWYVDDVLAQAEEYRGAEQEQEASAPSSGSSDSSGGRQIPTGGTEQTPNSYDLVDENRRMHYELDTVYAEEFERAAEGWNQYGGVSIEPSPSPEETDVVVADGQLSGQAGNTSSDGSITADPDIMASSTDNARVAVFAHELGHAEGFEHTAEDSVMNTPIITNSSENHTEPTPYDAALHREVWGGSAEGGGSSAPVGPSESLEDGGAEGGGVQGSTSAVFPLPAEYFDSYDDTWGASRGQGAHEGTDMFAPDGTPIYSIVSGTVTSASGADSSGWNYLGGWTTMIEATESVGPVQAGDMLYYAHQLEPSPLKPGDAVKAGDVIGKVGSTGEGSPGTFLQPTGRGRHLHLGWYDPSGARAEATSGAMNPYPLLQWLKESGGAASGDSTYSPSPGNSSGSLPPYCLVFEGTSILSGISEKAGRFFGGEGEGGGSGEPLGQGSAEELLNHENFDASPGSVSDLESGEIDPRLIATLLRIVEEHSIYVTAMASDHPYGRSLPASLGGGPNSHAYGLTADIGTIDGVSVGSGQTAAGTLDVGRIILDIPPGDRPDEVIGPTSWTAELGATREDGFITDPGFTEAHHDHLHIGYSP